MKYRRATLKDVPKLVELENACFNYDQLDSRNFRYFIQKGHDDLVVQIVDKEIAGYGLILYRKGTSLARLYSIAISPDYRGQGLGELLLTQLEKFAKDRDSSYLRLEVKRTNKAAISLYEKLGYKKFSEKLKYYDDNEDAICFEKKVRTVQRIGDKLHLPFYQQSTEFTCGPACLLMAMKGLNQKTHVSRLEEIQIWREATTIFMTAGHGGCGPQGLALAAHRRGFKAELFLNTKEHLFVKGVRQQTKKEIITLVQDGFDLEIKKSKIKVHYDEINWKTILHILKKGGIPLVLISSYRLTENKSPHWIVITGIAEDFVFFNDPFIENEDTEFTNTHIPVRKDEFEAMAKFGSNQIKSFVAIYK